MDPYKTLGISKTSTAKEITSAYRKLAKKYHPDTNKSKVAEDKFKKITNAYNTLNNPQKKKWFDEFGEQALDPSFDENKAKILRNYKNQTQSYNSEFDLSDFLSGFNLNSFKGFNRQPVSEHQFDVDYQTALKGGKAKFSIETTNGTKTYVINIPTRAKTGHKIKLASNKTGLNQDIILVLNVKPSNQQDSIELELSLSDFITGTKVLIPNTKLKLNIPPMTRFNKKFKIPKRGLNGQDIIVTTVLKFPDLNKFTKEDLDTITRIINKYK